MYIFWIVSRRQVLVLALLLLVLAVGGFGVGFYNQQLAEPAISSAEPVRSGPVERQAIALTFNVDWGEELLPVILSVLKANEVRATFFITGRWAKKFPELVQQIASQGHEVGNHGFSHPHVDNLNQAANQQEIKQTEALLRKLAGPLAAPLYAPPYGEHKSHVVAAAGALGYTTILWSIDTIDWQKGRTPAVVLEKVTGKAHNGAIVLMHPTPASARALPVMIERLRQQGYQLIPVGELLSIRNSLPE